MAALRSFLGGKVTVVVGDITEQRVDAIVNAANALLYGGGGVDGAIHSAGGSHILEECREIRRSQYPNGLPTGEAVVTGGGELPASFVIHTVGPVKGQHGDKEADLLASCYRNALAKAEGLGLTSIAIPSISTGAFGYPRREAAVVSSEAIDAFLEDNTSLEEVRLVFFTRGDAEIFLRHQRFFDERGAGWSGGASQAPQ